MGNALPTALGGVEEETYTPVIAEQRKNRENTPTSDAAGHATPTGPSPLSPPVLPRPGRVQADVSVSPHVCAALSRESFFLVYLREEPGSLERSEKKLAMRLYLGMLSTVTVSPTPPTQQEGALHRVVVAIYSALRT